MNLFVKKTDERTETRSALAKQIVCKGIIAKALVSWQLMTQESVQAGNRASKTGHNLQWWEHRSEWYAMTPVAKN